MTAVPRIFQTATYLSNIDRQMNYSTFVLKVQPYSQTCDFFVKYNVTFFQKQAIRACYPPLFISRITHSVYSLNL